MKLVAVEQAKVLDLIPLEELRPKGGIYLPEFISSISGRYGFVTFTKDLAEVTKDGAKFEHGRFVIEGSTVIIKELGLYSDGLIIDTHDSKVSDYALDDFLEWATKKYGLSERKSPTQRLYTSIVVVDFERNIEPALGAFSRMTGILAESLKDMYGWEHEYNLNRISFSVDPRTIPHLRSTQFYIERRTGVAFNQNRFWSGSALPNDRHLKLLEMIEQLG